MKKVAYVILLLVEAVLSFLALSLAWVNVEWIPCVVIIAVWAALLVWQILTLKKATHAENPREVRRRTCRRIALVMLVPLLGGIILLVYMFVGLASVI